MITKVPREGLTEYEVKYFYEAEVGERKNVRKITLNGSGGASVNGASHDTDNIDTDNEDLPEDDTDIEPDAGDVETDIMTEPNDDLGDDAGGDEMGDAATDDGIELEPDDESVDDPGGGDTTDDGDGGGSDIMTEPDDEEALADDSDGGGDAESDDSGEESQSDNGEGLRKRALFSRFHTLHDAIDKYIEKLNMMMAYSSELIVEYREACDAFDELKTYIYDYMLIRFSTASYPESMLFYQRVLTSVNLILDDLKDVDITGGDKKNKEKHISKQRKTSNKK